MRTIPGALRRVHGRVTCEYRQELNNSIWISESHCWTVVSKAAKLAQLRVVPIHTQTSCYYTVAHLSSEIMKPTHKTRVLLVPVCLGEPFARCLSRAPGQSIVSMHVICKVSTVTRVMACTGCNQLHTQLVSSSSPVSSSLQDVAMTC